MNTTDNSAVPGDFLGVTEEYAAGEGTGEDSEGKIFAIALGRKLEDPRARTVSVKPMKLIRPLQPGDLAYARVEDLYESMALLNFQIPWEGNVGSSGNGSAFMRISELDNSYVERLSDFIRIGDIIRARVLEIKPLGTYFTIKEPGLGVISAYCSRCRTELKQEGSGLVCPACGRHETRKIPGMSMGGGSRSGGRFGGDRRGSGRDRDSRPRFSKR